MRVTMRNQYDTFLYNVQNTQSRLMELNTQASSQKRINKPSDDAIGASRVLNYRDSIASISQYQSNIDTAKGWLGLADESMMQVSTVLTRLRSLAEQGATGTMAAKDREASSYEARQLFDQLISLSNTDYQGSSVFAGHKVEQDAFRAGLMVYDQEGEYIGQATGAAERSIVVQFVGAEGATATIGAAPPAGGPYPINYRYSHDGGLTWKSGQLADENQTTLELGGVSVHLGGGRTVFLSPESNTNRAVGSWLTVAPTAIYQGDHEAQSAVTFATANPTITVLPLGGFQKDVTVSIPLGVTIGNGSPFTAQINIEGVPTDVEVSNLSGSNVVLPTPYGGIQLSGNSTGAAHTFTINAGKTGVQNLGADVNAVGEGVFGRNVMVRIDKATTIGADPIQYSYSTDGGVNWSGGHTAPNGAAPELLVPGGKLALSPRGGSDALAQGSMFVIHPQTAAHNVEISANQFVQINNVGSTIFGGHYEHGTEPVFADSEPGRNIFVAVGKLVAALENNDQTGCSKALDDLRTGQDYFVTQLASVGARENRLEVAGTVLTGLKLNQKERMSNIEDVDLTTLLTDLANQQVTYEAVLKSSSMIMRMSLVNYL